MRRAGVHFPGWPTAGKHAEQEATGYTVQGSAGWPFSAWQETSDARVTTVE